jgi:hypothetical protein
MSLTNKAAALIFVCGLANCTAGNALAAVDSVGAAKVFGEAEAICERDGGALWGRSLCGPMLLVDPKDHFAAANQPDADGVLKPSGAIYTGRIPDDVNVANTATEWSGTRWTQVLWPLPDDAAQRHVLIAHELFHRIQPALGLEPIEGSNPHLDTFNGRYLLQLEWRALAKALTASAARERRAAIADAVLFRRERYRLFPGARADEAALEIQEGTAEYTGVRLGLETPQQRLVFALFDLSRIAGAPTFVRSFAYATGPAYGLLLDQADPHWREKLGSGAGFDGLLSAALKLPPPDFHALSAREAVYHDDGSLKARELKREQDRQARLAAFKAKLVDGPVLLIPMNNATREFNPQTLVPFGDLGTVYPTARLAGPWGVLEVDHGGALLSKENTTAAVPAAGIDAQHLQGEGWRLKLNPGWDVQPGSRLGDWVIRQTGGSGP